MNISLKKGMAIIIILAIVLISIFVLIIKRKIDIEKQNENIPNPEILDETIRLCKKQSENVNELYELINVDYIKLDNDRVISDHPKIQLKYKNQQDYNLAKNNINNGATGSDDINLILEYNLGEENDYTKDEKGKEMNIKYSEFIKTLEEAGYICD